MKTLIKLFNCAVADEPTLNFKFVNEIANKVGYLVHPDVCNHTVLAFLEEQRTDVNSTFYKDWEDIVSKSREELFFDQILHYATTYGTDFALGQGYVPNDGAENVPAFNTYKVIMPVTKKEMFDKCLGLLTAGIALKQETMHAVCDFMVITVKLGEATLDVDIIKNREAMIYLCDKLNITPSEPNSLLRYIVFKTTGTEMIIKNTETINNIKCSCHQFDFTTLNQHQLEGLASIFLRYKDIFLAFKHHESRGPVCRYRHQPSVAKENTMASINAPIINKLRKMAVKLHKPMKPGFWQTVLSEPKELSEVMNRLGELTTYKKVALMQSCIDRATAGDNQLYLVRNQKVFVRKNYNPGQNNEEYLNALYSILYADVVETLRKHSTKLVTKIDAATGEAFTEEVKKVVKVVNGMSMSLPSSEKSFIGNYPFGTSFKLTDHNFFGVYWRNEWGTRDYDLSFMSADGHKIGWNSNYYDEDKNIIFSGDMTSADPEASEVIYMKNAGEVGTIQVNQFNGAPTSTFRFFFGRQDNVAFNKNDERLEPCGYLVDPNCIDIKFDVTHKDTREIKLGVVDKDKVVLMDVNAGNDRVSRNAKNANVILDLLLHKANCFVDATEMLEAAGFEIVGSDYTDIPDIDYANLDKDSLIAIMKQD